ncbi:hypothetical protein TNCV_4515721 [Trichonephila clavipes]|nr:hypothetical protein TNCV_4515721 [Trichonephila clavipes]
MTGAGSSCTAALQDEAWAREQEIPEHTDLLHTGGAMGKRERKGSPGHHFALLTGRRTRQTCGSETNVSQKQIRIK